MDSQGHNGIMGYKWSFDIYPRNNFLRELCLRMPGNDISIHNNGSDDTGEYFYLSSPSLEELNDLDQVIMKANQLIQLINGISYLIHEDKMGYPFFTLGNLYNEAGYKVQYNKQGLSHVFDVEFIETDKSQADHIYSDLISLAKKDDFVLTLFFTMGQKQDYRTLYQIFDHLVNKEGSLDALKKLAPNKTQLTEFQRTANSFEVLGVHSRHGLKNEDAPSKPLSLEKAHLLIDELIRDCLRRHYNLELPVIRETKFTAEDLFDN